MPPRSLIAAPLVLGLAQGIEDAQAAPRKDKTVEVDFNDPGWRNRFLFLFTGTRNACDPRSPSAGEYNNSFDHSTLYAPSQGEYCSYDTFLFVQPAATGGMYFVQAPSSTNRYPLRCVVSDPSVSEEPTFETACTPSVERGETCTYTVLPQDFTRDAVCPSQAQAVYDRFFAVLQEGDNLQVPTLPLPWSPEEPKVVKKEPRIVQVHPDFAANVLVSVGNEAFSEYNQGFDGVGSQVPRPGAGLSVEWAPFGLQGLRVGADTRFVSTLAGTGWESSGLMVGTRQGPWWVAMNGGISGEPDDRQAPAQDGVPYVGVDARRYFDVPRIPGSVFAEADLTLDIFRFPMDPRDTHLALAVGWTMEWDSNPAVVVKMKPESVTAEPQVEVEQPKFKTSFEKGVAFETSLPSPSKRIDDKEKAILAAEAVRLSEDLRKGVSTTSTAMPQATAGLYIRLTGLNYPLSKEAYWNGFIALRKTGNIALARQALLWAGLVDPTSEDIKVNIADIDARYGYVHLVIPLSERAELNTPEAILEAFKLVNTFSPDERAAVDLVVQTLQETGEFTGFLPVGSAQGFAVKPYAEEQRTQVFRLSK